jgi:hypothetical protein
MGQLVNVEFNADAEVVIVMDGLAWVFEIVDVEEITGATALAVVVPTNVIIEVNRKVTAVVEIIFFNMKALLNATSLLDATTLKFKLLSESGFLFT